MTDYGQLKSKALSALREVAELAKDAGATSLAHTLKENRIARLEDGRFHLVVLGEFNHGKTTFVNALLGAPVLPAGVTPTTAVIHRIEHGDKHASASLEDGTTRELSFDKLAEYEVDGSAAADSVAHLNVTYPSELLAEGVVLVDTPGVNDLNEARSEITYGYIPQSDAIVFLLDAGQILKESERQFVATKLLAASRDKLFFVINKIDLLDDEERAEAIAYAKMNLGKIVKDPRVFALSAEQALEGERAASGLDPFVTELQSFLKNERGRVLLDNALDAGIRTADTLTTGIEIQQRALSMEQSDLDRRLSSLEQDLESSAEQLANREQQIRESLAAVKAVLRSDCKGFADKFALSLPDEIEQSDAKDLRKYLGGFIEERFKEFADEEASKITRRLEKVAEEAIAFVSEDARARSERLSTVLGDGSPLNLEVNTFAYDVGVFAVGAFGVTIMMLSNLVVGGALTLAAPVLAYVFRGRADKQVKERAKEEAPKAVREAAEKMADEFEKRIDEFGDRLVEFVTAANADVTRSIAELVRTAKNARAGGAEAQQALESGAGMSLVRLADVRSRISTLRKSLWANSSPNIH